jgi:hypothetical protein
LDAALAAETAKAAVPAALASVTTEAAVQCAAGGLVITEALIASVARLTKGALTVMFLTKIKALVLTLIATAIVAAGVGALAQQTDPGGRPGRTHGAASSRLRFEIRTWKDKVESGDPIEVNITDDGFYQVEALDAVIQIRPRTPRNRRVSEQTVAQKEEFRRLVQNEQERDFKEIEEKALPEVLERNRRNDKRKAAEDARAGDQMLKKLVQEDPHAGVKLGLHGPMGTVTGVAPGRTSVREIATINLGSDDGLVLGQILYIYTDKIDPQRVGELLIIETEPDKAVGSVVDLKAVRDVKKGDIVCVGKASVAVDQKLEKLR